MWRRVLTGLNILVIDDDPDVLHTVAATLEARGATTVAAEDRAHRPGGGRRWWHRHDDRHFCHAGTGWRRRSRQIAQGASGTAGADRDRLSESAKLDAVLERGVGLLRKPFSSEALVRAISELLPKADLRNVGKWQGSGLEPRAFGF